VLRPREAEREYHDGGDDRQWPAPRGERRGTTEHAEPIGNDAGHEARREREHREPSNHGERRELYRQSQDDRHAQRRKERGPGAARQDEEEWQHEIHLHFDRQAPEWTHQIRLVKQILRQCEIGDDRFGRWQRVQRVRAAVREEGGDVERKNGDDRRDRQGIDAERAPDIKRFRPSPTQTAQCVRRARVPLAFERRHEHERRMDEEEQHPEPSQPPERHETDLVGERLE